MWSMGYTPPLMVKTGEAREAREGMEGKKRSAECKCLRGEREKEVKVKSGGDNVPLNTVFLGHFIFRPVLFLRLSFTFKMRSSFAPPFQRRQQAAGVGFHIPFQIFSSSSTPYSLDIYGCPTTFRSQQNSILVYTSTR